MMARNEDTTSGLSGVLATGILTMVLGMILAVLSLVTQPVQLLTRVPDEASIKPGKVIYVKGARSGRTAWRGKEQAWKSGQVDTLIVTEAELNQWSEDRFRTSEGDAAATGESRLGFLRMEVAPANFRILDGQIQMATEVDFPGLPTRNQFVFQVKGNFEKTTGGVRFVRQSATLGQAPIGAIDPAGGWFFHRVLDQFEKTGEIPWLVDSLGDLDSIEISENQLILRRNSQG